MRMHVLDSIESIRNRFGEFYFPMKIIIFRNILKILENPWFGLILDTRVDVRQLSRGVGGAREIRKMMLGGAVGAPEARNMLGMLVVMSLQLSISIGGV